MSFVAVFAAATACASVSPTLSVRERFLAALDSLGYDTAQAAGPRVAISIESEPFSTRRITPRIHVADDAYVAVVNVWPSGEASVVWPESPEDDGFLAGGRTYAIPSMFSGFATIFPPTGAQGLRFVRFSRSSEARIGARGPGYVVLLASRTPLDLGALDTAGYFDDVTFGNDLRAMEPSAVIPRLAVLAGGGSTALTLDHARYGGYDVMSFASHSSLSYADRSSGRCGLRYGNPALNAWDAAFGAAGCGFGGYDEPMMPRWFVPRLPVIPRDSGRPPADTLHTPDVQQAAVRAAWAALVERTGARSAGRELVAEDDVVELPRSREPQPLDEAVQRRTRERTAEEVQPERRRAGRTRKAEPIDRAPGHVTRPTPRREEAHPQPMPREETRPQPAPRAEPAPRAAPRDPAPRHVDPAPRQQPAERPRSGDPEPQP